ncbi:MAG: lytic murein transglycosylase [Candidatus Nealsonbacteria bacterium]
MFSYIPKILIFFILISALILPGFIFAEDLEKKCLDLSIKGCVDLSKDVCKVELQECEKYYTAESQKIQNDINITAGEKKTLQSKISGLNNKIKDLNYQINKSNLIIKDLGVQIGDTETSIIKSVSTIEESRNKLAVILRTIYEEDEKPIVEILLTEPDLSSFFDNIIALEILNSKNKDLLFDIKSLKSNLEVQKVSLDEEKVDLEEVVKMKELQKGQNAEAKGEQEYYLGLTEAQYQQKINEKADVDRKAAEIRSRIFELVGVTKAPTFGEAYQMAKNVESLLGVRPALVLAVLQQESAIGKNVGQCYLKNSATGDGIVINSGKFVSKVMKPTRDVSPFLTITQDLGRDPFTTPVSCPMSFGYGGAMGPAQFIPSTWILYKEKLKNVLGRSADPWNIQDAFTASGLYLADNGASAQTYNSEWRAAMIYFSGSTNPKYSFYGNSVMNTAAGFQKDIEALEASNK